MIQVRLTYTNSRIEGIRLFADQTPMIFGTGITGGDDGLPHDDVSGTPHHFRAVYSYTARCDFTIEGIISFPVILTSSAFPQAETEEMTGS